MRGKRICLFPHPSQQHDFFYRQLNFQKKKRKIQITKKKRNENE